MEKYLDSFEKVRYNDQRNKCFVFMLGGDLYDNLI